MVAQLASFPLKINSTGTNWKAEVVSGGNFTKSGSIGIRLQFHNRVGLNLLSDRIPCNYSAGDKIVITLSENLIPEGVEVFKIVISGETSGLSTQSVQLVEWNALQSDQETYNSLPAILELTEDAHIETLLLTVPNTSSLPISPINGMVRQNLENGQVLRFSALENQWIEELKGVYVHRNTTQELYGSDQTLNPTLPYLIQPLIKGNSFEGSYQKIWFSNGLEEGPGKVYTKGTGLNIQVWVNNSSTNSKGISYSQIFSGKIYTQFLGYVRRSDGSFDSSYETGEGNIQKWYVEKSSLILPADLTPGYAASFKIWFAYDTTAMQAYLPNGADITFTIYEEGAISHLNPLGHVMGAGIFPEGDRFRILPDKRLGGNAILGTGDTFYTTTKTLEIPLLGIQPDTASQKVILMAAYNALALVKPSTHILSEGENLRAIISTEPGTSIPSEFSEILAVSENDAIKVTFVLSSTIRDDYPDIIAGMLGADFSIGFIKIFLEKDGTDIYEYIIPAVEGTNQYTILDLEDGENILGIPSNSPDFCCFGYGDITLTANTNGGSLPLGDYRVAIAYYYPSPNYSITKISHSVDLGCLPEFKSTIQQALDTFEGWKPPVATLNTLRNLSDADLADGDIRLVKATNSLYRYHSTESGEDDGINIIRPIGITVGAFIPVSANLPNVGQGSILVHDGNSYTPLALGTNGQVLQSNGSNLIWGNSGGGGGSGVGGPGDLSLTSLGQLITALNDPLEIGVINYPSSEERTPNVYENGEANIFFLKASDNESDPPIWNKLLNYTNTARGLVFTDPINTNPVFQVLPITEEAATNNYVLVAQQANEVTAPFTWRQITLSALPDTWDITYVPQHGDVLSYDATEGLWIPKQNWGSVILNSLSDTDVATPENGLSLTWDSFRQKWIASLPKLDLVDGINSEDVNVNIPGDSYWSAVAILLSAQRPYTDLSSNQTSVTQASTLVNAISPYTNQTNSYEFSNVNRSSVSVATNESNIIGSNNFCIELWAYPTTLTTGSIYRLVSRGNNTEADFSLDLQESGGTNQFKIFFRGYLANGNIQQLTSTTVLNVNNWYHIAVTRSGNSWRLFINGIEEAIATNSNNLKSTFINSSLLLLTLGSSSGASTLGWTGYLEDFRLTITQARYISNFTPNTQPFPRQAGGTETSKRYYINLSDLADTDISNPTNNQVIAWNTSLGKWKTISLAPSGDPIDLSLNNLNDVSASNPTNGQILTFNSTSGIWELSNPLVNLITSVNGLTGEVILTSDNIVQGSANLYFTEGNFNTYYSQKSINGLIDVSITNPQIGNGLIFDGNNWINSPTTAPVSSVNGLIGAIILSTSEIGEGTNLYYTDARVDNRIQSTNLATLNDVANTTPTDGQILAFSTSSGQWEPTTILAGGQVDSVNGQIGTVVLFTTDIGEGTNLYYTDARVYNRIQSTNLATLNDVANTTPTDGQILAFSTSSGQWEPTTILAEGQVDSVNGQIGTVVLSTTDIGEGTNLYYTDARVDNRIQSTNLATLNDVANTTPTDGQVLAFSTSSGQWEPMTSSGTGATTLAALNDVANTTPTDGQILAFSTSSGQWEPTTILAGGQVDSVNGQIGTVVLSTSDIAEGTNLYYSNARVDIRIQSTNLSAIANVSATTPTDGQVLGYSSSNNQWEPQSKTPLQEFNYQSTNYTLVASDHGKYIICQNALTLTMPNSGLPPGFQCVVFNDSPGTITLSTGITIKTKGTLLENQYGAAHVTFTGTAWIVLGDVT